MASASVSNGTTSVAGSTRKVASVQTANVEPKWKYEPGHPAAIKDGPQAGYVPYPNINMMTEFTDALEAARAALGTAQAGLRTAEAAVETARLNREAAQARYELELSQVRLAESAARTASWNQARAFRFSGEGT